MKLPDGAYRLARDVENPVAARVRRSDWTTAKEFKAGDTFFLRTISNFKTDDVWQELQQQGKYSSSVSEQNPLFAVILMACDRIEETPSLYLKRNNQEHLVLEVLDRLEANCTISVNDVALALNEIIHPED